MSTLSESSKEGRSGSKNGLDTSDDDDDANLWELDADSNDNYFDGGLDELSTTLKEIDESLSQEHGDCLTDSINASSEYLKELLKKQKKSHWKIQRFQENIQRTDIQVAMIQPNQFDSAKYPVETNSYLMSESYPTVNRHLRNEGDSNQRLSSEILPTSRSDDGSLETTFEDDKNQRLQVTFDETKRKEEEEEKEDSLFLFFDLMAAHIKHDQLERERIKLDVIVALRLKLQALYDDESIENIPAKLAEKLYEHMYDVLFEEVTRVKSDEEEKFETQRRKYEAEMTKLSKELEAMAKEKCEVSVQLNSCKEQLSRHKEVSCKSDRLEGRLSYLEEVLRSVEKENEKYKVDIKQQHTHNEDLRAKIRTLENDLQCMSGKYDSLRSSEEHAKKNFDTELQKLIDQNTSLNDRLFTLQNNVQDITRERDQLRNSTFTDRSIIKHLEQKLSKNDALLESLTNDSTRNSDRNSALEAKVVEYKKKLKKCAHGIDMTRQQNLKLKESVNAAESERDEYWRSGHELQLRLSEQELKHSSEMSELQRKVDVLHKDVNIYKDKVHALQRANSYLKKQVASAPVPSLSGVNPPNMSNSHRARSGVNKSIELSSDGSSESSVLSSSPAITTKRSSSQRIYTSEEMKLFLREMAYKLENTENEVRLADSLVSSADDIDSQLEEKVAQIRLQMADISQHA